MKTFNELTRKELSDLNETQVDAYVDIELAQKGIIKPIETQIDYPNFVKANDLMPEMDMTIYEVDGYNFLDIESAQKFSAFVGTLQQVKADYDYYSKGENVYYVKQSEYKVPQIIQKKIYSEAKYIACKAKIKAIRDKENKEKSDNDVIVDSVINYEAIDNIKYATRAKVREAIDFFARAESMAREYDKYLTITNDHLKTLETIFTVYNVQDIEMKTEVENIISNRKTILKE